MTESFIDILMKNRLFEGIEPENIESLLICLNCMRREYSKNEFIALEGEKLEHIGIIVKGSACVVKENKNGDRMIMLKLEPGDMFGEIAAFSENPQWPANVYAQTPCRILLVPSGMLSKTCGKACRFHMILIRNMLKTVAEKALQLNRMVDYLTIKSLRGKISAFLYEQYKKEGRSTFSISMNRNELADFLNVSRPSMSREMGRMKSEGLIDFHRETFKICDAEKILQSFF
jgi:CRP-like cAMP-binding protein